MYFSHIVTFDGVCFTLVLLSMEFSFEIHVERWKPIERQTAELQEEKKQRRCITSVNMYPRLNFIELVKPDMPRIHVY